MVLICLDSIFLYLEDGVYNESLLLMTKYVFTKVGFWRQKNGESQNQPSPAIFFDRIIRVWNRADCSIGSRSETGRMAGRIAWFNRWYRIIAPLLFSIQAIPEYAIDSLYTKYIRKIHWLFNRSFIYCIFIYGASRDLRDASELLLLQYGQTPMFILSGVLMVIVCYALYQGIETLARTGEIIFGLVFIMILVTFFSIIGSNVIRLENLLPVLENGWKPVITTAFPERVFSLTVN